MGLNAHVRCACLKAGKTNPFPFPGRLRVGRDGEPYLVDAGSETATQDLRQLLEFDRWNDDWGCEHHGFAARARIGDIAYVAHIRSWVSALQKDSGPAFPILLNRVVQNGVHCGDWISNEDSKLLVAEIKAIEPGILDELQREFVETMKRLCEASIANGNPILF